MGYYFIIVGAIISLFALWAFFAHLKLWMCAESADGVIVDFDQRLRFVGRRKQIYYHPTIEFETASGHTHVFTYGGGSRIKRGKVGDSIVVLYDPDKPANARVNSFLGMWAGPIAAAILGVGCLYAGIDLVNNP